MPKPPPRSSSGSSTPCSSRTCGVQAEHPAGRDLEAGVSKICEPMWRVQADAARARSRASDPARPPRGASPLGEREAELLVLVRGRDVLVRVRLDADGDAHQHAAPRTPSRRRASASRSISSKESTTIRPTPASSARLDLGVATCCCRASRSAAPGTPARSATASSPPVQTSRLQPLLGHPARDRRAQERLAGVVDVAPPARTRRETPAAARRGSRPRRARSAGCRARGEVGGRRRRPTVSAPSRVARRRRRTRARRTSALHVGGRAAASAGAAMRRPRRAARRPRASRATHIRSGARDAEQAEAVGEHLRVASLSHSRVRCRSVTSSSPRGSTRHVVVPLVVRRRRAPPGSARPGAARAARPPGRRPAGTRASAREQHGLALVVEQRRVEPVLAVRRRLRGVAQRSRQVRACAYCT